MAEKRTSLKEYARQFEEFRKKEKVGEQAWIGGTIEFAVVGIFGEMTVHLTFPNGQKMRLEGETWGAGVGPTTDTGGGPWGDDQGNYRTPEDGEVWDFQITSVAEPTGTLEVFFSKDGVVYGCFICGGFGGSAFVGGGSGTWHYE
jgi:hypothetical protein